MSEKAKPATRLRFELDAVASPARVMRTAEMFSQALSRAFADVPDGSVTLVVENLGLHSELRGWDEVGGAIVSRVKSVVLSPSRSMRQAPSETRAIAEVLASFGESFKKANARFLVPDKKADVVVPVDEIFIQTMKAVTSDPENLLGEISGFLTLYSPIFRLGRLDEGKELRARVKIREGTVREIPLATGAPTKPFLDALDHGRTVAIRARATWIKDKTGLPILSESTLVAVGISGEVVVTSGKQLLRAAHDQVSLSPSDLERILAERDLPR